MFTYIQLERGKLFFFYICEGWRKDRIVSMEASDQETPIVFVLDDI